MRTLQAKIRGNRDDKPAQVAYFKAKDSQLSADTG